jgi:electron transport complex protein RnfB
MASEMLYRKLQRHLDRMPVPFPPTESGVELRILERLFTPEEAEIALELSAIPEPAAVIHKRLKSKMDLNRLTEALGQMVDKGTVLSFEREGVTQYAKLMFAIGMYERQVNRLTPEFERDSLQYLEGEFGKAAFRQGKTGQMRVVPVNRSIEVERNVAQYEDIRAWVKSCDGPFAKGNCICRQGKDLLGHPCKQTDVRANCLTIGMAAQWMIEHCGSHLISREEMLAMLDNADRQGLVLQTENTQRPLFVCCCCHCCCGVLNTVKQFPRPADYFTSNFYATVDADTCQSCGTCEARCQMDAIHIDGKTEVDLARCIGCGLCVTTCPSEAMRLEPKPEPKAPPDQTIALYMKMLRERYGPLGMLTLAAKRAMGLKI